MSRWKTRNYTNEVPSIHTKQLKTCLSSPRQWVVTSKGIKLLVEAKGGCIEYQLANGYKVIGSVDKTALSFGWRYWFICPYCQKRRGELYYTNKQIACRECFNLHYSTQSEDRLERIRRKIRLMRSRLFDDPKEYCNLFNHSYSLSKRKGISQKRFDQEKAMLLHIEGIYWRSMVSYIDKLTCKIKWQSKSK